MPKDRNKEPFALVCLYLQSLSAEELDSLNALPENFCQPRFEAKIINSLEQQGLLEFDWQNMEITLTDEGIEKTQALVKEISNW